MGEKQTFVVKAEPKGLLKYLRHYSRRNAPCYEVPGWELLETDILERWADDGALRWEIIGIPKDEPDEAWTSDYPRLASLHAMPLGDGRTEVTLSACDELGPWAEDLAHRMIELWPEARSALPAEGGPTAASPEPKAPKKTWAWEHIISEGWTHQALRLWCEERLTANDIGKRLGYSGKTVLNRFSELRTKHGPEVIPTDDMRKGRDMRDMNSG